MDKNFDDLFKTEYSKIVSRLVKILGSHQFDIAENIAQETLMKAIQVWPIQGMPERPAAWLTTVAKNLTFDYLKRVRFVNYDSVALDHFAEDVQTDEAQNILDEEIKDDLLRMIFICCHPRIPNEQSLALTLKSLCGLSTEEIARAFLAKDEAIAQRIVRAKKLIRDEQIKFVMPEEEEISRRLDRVLEVIYLMFNEGYFTHSKNDLTRNDICAEALNLCEFLCQSSRTAFPKTFALAALICFQSSRLKVRKSDDGEILLLENQDRSLWDLDLIEKGFYYLNLSSTGNQISSFHLQAGIAACHASSPTFEETNWSQIIFYYDQLILMNSNSILKLNRAVAIGFNFGFESSLKILNDSELKLQLSNYYLYFGTVGEMNLRVGNIDEAIKNFELALDLNPPQTQKVFLQNRISCAHKSLEKYNLTNT